jgi:hypothetical protein
MNLAKLMFKAYSEKGIPPYMTLDILFREAERVTRRKDKRLPTLMELKELFR